ncbi:MAG TPA: hypothetical protein VHM19_17145 [Polyangiales bacterium]|nr:hypothetical protein [Polyangiales bacterium]
MLSADLSFRLGARTPPPSASALSEPASLPPSAAAPCDLAALCAWEAAQVQTTLTLLDPGDPP